jgi:peptidoglycan L-alanyl-D-glutamate endopeptidase CwlK
MDARKVGIGAAILGLVTLGVSKLMSSSSPPANTPLPKGWAASLPIIGKLDPSIQGMAQQVLVNAANEGIDLVVTQGLRDNALQAQLYAQGRTAPGAIVTNAPPGSSWHNFGLAFDVAVLKDGKATWPENEALWQRIGAIGKAVGLEWGGDFHTINDRPHFEYHPGLTLAMARAGQRPGSSGTTIV